MNPDRYAIIYDSKYDSDDNASNGSSTTTAPISSSSSTYSTFPKVYQNYYYNKYHEGILEIAKGLLNILSSQLVDKTVVTEVKENDLVSSIRVYKICTKKDKELALVVMIRSYDM